MVVLVLAVTACVGVPAGRGVAEADPHFSLSVEAAVALGARVPADSTQDWQELLREYDCRYQLDGSLDIVTHTIIRLQSRDSLDSWSLLNASWQPWREDKPEIQARVINTSGQVSHLNQAAAVEVGSGIRQDNLRTDSRTVSAPLPNLEIGAIVEFNFVERIRPAKPGLGVNGDIALGSAVPVAQLNVRLSWPEGMTIQYRSRGGAVAHTSLPAEAGRVGLEIALRDLPAYGQSEALRPYDVPAVPVFSYGSATSWQAVATAFQLAADAAPVPEAVATWAATQAGTASDQPAAVSAVLAALRRQVRYTGILFGQNAIIPRDTATILADGFGDCKDQASLLVNALRSLDIEARLALLRAGTGLDIDPMIPGMDGFNHAIVYLPGLRLWIDPTASYVMLGDLPAGDRLRQALVIDPASAGLETTPGAATGADWYREVREVVLAPFGPACLVREMTNGGGLIDQYLRGDWTSQPRETMLTNLRNYAVSAYQGTEPSANFPSGADLTTPFFLEVSAADCALGQTDTSYAAYPLRMSGIFTFLPDLLKPGEDAPEPGTRRLDVYLPNVHRNTIEYRVTAPPGFRLTAPPEDFTLDLGPAVLSATFRSDDPGQLTAVYELNFRMRRFQPAELDAYHAGLRQLNELRTPRAIFESVSATLASQGRLREAWAELTSLQEAYPEESLYRVQAAGILFQAGFVEDAVTAAAEAVTLDDESAFAHQQLAFYLLHDPFKRQFGIGSDPARAAAEYLRAFELDSKNVFSLFNHAQVLMRGTDGSLYGGSADLAAAASAWERGRGQIAEAGMADRYLALLFRMERYRDIVNFCRGLTDSKLGGKHYLAAVALESGLDAAVALASQLWSNVNERRTALMQAATSLIGLRHYVDGAEMMLTSARSTANFATIANLARVITAVQNYDGLDTDVAQATPEGLVRDIFHAVLVRQDLPEAFLAYDQALLDRPDFIYQVQKGLGDLWGSLSTMGFSGPILVDLLTSVMTVRGQRVGDLYFGVIGMPILGVDRLGTLVLELLDGQYRLLDFNSTTGLGYYLCQLVERGQGDEARRALAGFQNLARSLPAFNQSLGDTAQKLLEACEEQPCDVWLAAILLDYWDIDESANQLIGDYLNRALAEETDPAVRYYLYQLLCYLAAQAEDEARLAAILEKADTSLSSVNQWLGAIRLFRNNGAVPAARVLLDQALAAYPDEPDLLRQSSFMVGSEAGPDAFFQINLGLVETGAANDTDFNNTAWGALFLEDFDFSVLETLGLSARLLNGNASSLHTAACYLGALGRYEEALSAFTKILDGSGDYGPSDLWVAHGYLALAFGLEERARLSFQRAAEQLDPDDIFNSAALAQSQLQRLDNQD
ncbi:MAG: hypothetical protein A2Y35_00665 [Spirochaetes bacterium GWE1_60_18]|nr:MAG: hypothetical protein A2Y35_00665 [Spirochaetes bacterium GWE1_60_18]